MKLFQTFETLRNLSRYVILKQADLNDPHMRANPKAFYSILRENKERF